MGLQRRYWKRQCYWLKWTQHDTGCPLCVPKKIWLLISFHDQMTHVFKHGFIFVVFIAAVRQNPKNNVQCAVVVWWHIAAVCDLNKTEILVTWAEFPSCYQCQQMFDILESIFLIKSSPHHIISWESMPGQYHSSEVRVHLICLTSNMAFWQASWILLCQSGSFHQF